MDLRQLTLAGILHIIWAITIRLDIAYKRHAIFEFALQNVALIEEQDEVDVREQPVPANSLPEQD